MSVLLRPGWKIFESTTRLQAKDVIGGRLVHLHGAAFPLRDQRGKFNVSSHATFSVGHGLYGYCYKFNGTNQYVPIDGAALSIADTANGRIAIVGLATTANTGSVYRLRNSGSGTPIFSIHVGNEGVSTVNGAVKPIVRDNNSNLRYLSSATKIINDGKFHIVALRIGTDRIVDAFCDGQKLSGWNLTIGMGITGLTTTTDSQFFGAGEAYLKGELYFALAFDGYAGDSTLRGLTQDPRAIFEPDLARSFHFFTAAGGGVTVEPGKAELALTGYAPTVTVSTSDLTVAPDKADLTLTGQAPTVSVTENHLALPGKADLSLTGHAPTVAVTEHQTVAPGAADLSLTGFAPTVSVSENTTVTPDVAALALTGYAPSISVTQNHLALPGKADLALTAYAPTVTKTEHVIVNPTTGALVITGYAPTVTEQSQSPVISPAAAALILQTYAPTAVNSGDVAADVGQTPAGGRGRGRRRRLYVLEFRGEEFFFESLDDIRDFLAQQIEEQQPKVRRRGRPKKVVLEVPSLTFDGMEIGDLKVGKFSLAQALQERRKVPINDIRSAIERMIDDDDEEAAIAVL